MPEIKVGTNWDLSDASLHSHVSIHYGPLQHFVAGPGFVAPHKIQYFWTQKGLKMQRQLLLLLLLLGMGMGLLLPFSKNA